MENEAKPYLKPCPFCGGEAKVFQDQHDNEWCIACVNGDCEYCSNAYNNMQEAINKWNTRFGESIHEE